MRPCGADDAAVAVRPIDEAVSTVAAALAACGSRAGGGACRAVGVARRQRAARPCRCARAARAPPAAGRARCRAAAPARRTGRRVPAARCSRTSAPWPTTSVVVAGLSARRCRGRGRSAGAGDAVQHLGQRGLHAGALAGGQDHDVEVIAQWGWVLSSRDREAGQSFRIAAVRAIEFSRARGRRRRLGAKTSVGDGHVIASRPQKRRNLSNDQIRWRFSIRLVSTPTSRASSAAGAMTTTNSPRDSSRIGHQPLERCRERLFVELRELSRDHTGRSPKNLHADTSEDSRSGVAPRS